jgi:hypothetical protein
MTEEQAKIVRLRLKGKYSLPDWFYGLNKI